MLPKVALITECAGDDPEQQPILGALRQARLDATCLTWEAEADWADFDLVLVCSAVFTPQQRQQFLRWAREVEEATALANPARMLVKFSDLTYLRDMAGRGVAVPPTIWVEPGDDAQAAARAASDAGWQRVVVASNTDPGTEVLVDGPQAAAEAAARLAATGAIVSMQQAAPGERISATVIDGRVADALDGAGNPVEVTGAARDLLEVALEVGADGEDLLFARVDLVQDADQWALHRMDVMDVPLAVGAQRLAEAVRGVVTPDVRNAGIAGG